MQAAQCYIWAKASPRAWDITVDPTLLSLGFSRLKTLSGMYFGKVSNAWGLSALYLDDLAIIFDDLNKRQCSK
jgi:hypothetical protein